MDDNNDLDVVYLDDLEEIDDSMDILHKNNGAEELDLDEEVEVAITDLSKLTFKQHNRPVFCGEISKNGLLAVTGGEDDVAYVWSIETLKIVLECTGHKDSVTEVGFSFDDQYVATGDLGGLIQVWSLKDNKLLWCYEGNDLEWLIWHQMANVLFSGFISGEINIWQIPQGNCKVLNSYGMSTTCGKILLDGKRLLAGYCDGQLRLWDIKSATVLWHLTENIPGPGITSLDTACNSSLCIIAPTAQGFKLNDGHRIGSFLANDQEEIEVAAFNSNSELLATGSLLGKICLWDIKKNSIRHEAKLDAGITTLQWKSPETFLIGTTDGCVHICNAISGTLIESLTGHTEEILSISLNKDGSTVLTTSDDSTAKLFSIKAE